MPTKCKIHSGEVERARVSSARAKWWPKVVRPVLCDEASAAMQEHGFQASEAVLRNIDY